MAGTETSSFYKQLAKMKKSFGNLPVTMFVCLTKARGFVDYNKIFFKPAKASQNIF